MIDTMIVMYLNNLDTHTHTHTHTHASRTDQLLTALGGLVQSIQCVHPLLLLLLALSEDEQLAAYAGTARLVTADLQGRAPH